MINIAAFQPNSFIDYPGKIASVIFLGGCNMRCYYCHNHNILCSTSNITPIESIMPRITEQLGFIDGVVITGGEPTLHPHLTPITQAIKELGLLVKLDTNGTNPQILKSLVEGGLVDYVAMDIKAGQSRYNEIAGVCVDFAKIGESINFLIQQDRIDYQFRTTLAPTLTEDDMAEIATLINGAKTWQLQKCNSKGQSTLKADRVIELVKPHVGEIVLRGF